MMIKIPNLKKINISIGYNGIQLFEAEELENAQTGYSKSSRGEILIGTKDGDWKENWLVIGIETCCGDPIFTDTSNPNFPIYTAIHGEGSWDPVLISNSYIGFLLIIDKLGEIAKGREYPTQMESNPMTQKEYDEFLQQVINLGGIKDSFFWALLVSDNAAGIGPEN